MRHRALQAGVAVALSAGEHPAAGGAGFAAPAAGGAAGGGYAGSKAVPPRAVEALLVSPGAGDAELQPLQEGDHACFVFPGGGCCAHGGVQRVRRARGGEERERGAGGDAVRRVCQCLSKKSRLGDTCESARRSVFRWAPKETARPACVDVGSGWRRQNRRCALRFGNRPGTS